MDVSYSGILDNQIVGKPTRVLILKVLFVHGMYCVRTMNKSCNHYRLETERQTRHNNTSLHVFKHSPVQP